MNNNTGILTHVLNLRALDASADGVEVQAGLFVINSSMGNIAEPVIDTEDPNPDFMFQEDVDAYIEEMEEYYAHADAGYYYSGSGEWSEDSSYEDYLNR